MEGPQAIGAIAYARGISTPPDDLASQLERLLDEPSAGHSPAIDPVAPPIDAPDQPDEQVELAAALEGMRHTLEDQLDELRGQLDDAFNEMAGRIAHTDGRLVSFRSAVEEQAEASATARTRADDALASHVAADRLHLEAAIDQLRREVVAWRDDPVTLDSRSVEETVRQGTLRNAADIATLAHAVETLGTTIRRQDARLAELHATLDWIKQRLLNR